MPVFREMAAKTMGCSVTLLPRQRQESAITYQTICSSLSDRRPRIKMGSITSSTLIFTNPRHGFSANDAYSLVPRCRINSSCSRTLGILGASDFAVETDYVAIAVIG